MSDALGEKIGIVQGTTKISSFSFSVTDLQKVMYGQYVVAKDRQTGALLLAQIVDITASGTYGIAECNVLGEIRDSKLFTPKRPIPSGSEVYMPKRELLERIISSGLPDRRILIGRVLTHPEFVPVYFNPDDLAKHMVVIAATGGGKSYTLGVIIEEILEFVRRESGEYAIVIFDVHNEYGGLLLPNEDPEQIEKLKQYGLEPKGYADQILVFDWQYNPPRLSDVFTPDRLLFLYGIKEQRFALYLKELMKDKKQATLEELRDLVQASDLHVQTKKALLHRIVAIMESGLVGKDSINLTKIIKPGYATIFRLASTPMGDQGIRFFVADVLLALYKLYRERKITFKTIIVIDEAHIFAPRRGKDPVKEIIERIVREGRKYGLWVVLATQGSRDLSNVILINCATLLALRMQKEDISELTRIFDVPRGVAEALTMVKPGKGYLKAPSLAIPVMIEVRPKRTLDLKGRPNLIAKAEEAVKKACQRTIEALKLRREEVKPPKIEKKKVEEKLPPKPEPKLEVITKPEVILKPSEVQKPKKLPEEKPFFIELRGAVAEEVPKKEEEIREEVFRRAVKGLAEEIESLGFAAKKLVRKLYEFGDMPIAQALSMVDDFVIEALKALGIAEERYGFLRLTIEDYLRRRLGRKVSYSLARKALKEALEMLGEKLSS